MSIVRAEADLATLEKQSSRLRSELANVEAQEVKVRAYIEMARLYETGFSAATVAGPATYSPKPDTREFGGTLGKALTSVIEIVRDEGKPIHTRVLVERLAAMGIVIGGKQPVGNLSGILSRSGKFVNSRTDGWVLKEQQRAQGDA